MEIFDYLFSSKIYFKLTLLRNYSFIYLFIYSFIYILIIFIGLFIFFTYYHNYIYYNIL